MKKLFGILLLAGLVSAPGYTEGEIVEESKHSWDVGLDNFARQDMDNYGFDLTVGHNYKFNADYTLTTELNGAASKTKLGDTAAVDEDEWDDWKITRGYLRVHLAGPTLAELGGGWKFAVDYRFTLPTSKRDQDAGAYGRLAYRTKISNTLTDWLSLSLRNYVDVWFNRNAYQVHDAAGAGNKLWKYTTGVVTVFTLMDGLSLTYGAYVGATMFGEAKTADTGTTWGYDFLHELELLYTIASLDNLNVGLAYGGNPVEWAEGDDFTYLDSQQNIVLRLAKSF